MCYTGPQYFTNTSCSLFRFVTDLLVKVLWQWKQITDIKTAIPSLLDSYPGTPFNRWLNSSVQTYISTSSLLPYNGRDRQSINQAFSFNDKKKSTTSTKSGSWEWCMYNLLHKLKSTWMEYATLSGNVNLYLLRLS